MSSVPDSMSQPGAVVHHILVVDENRDSVTFLKKLLEAHGFLVTVAKDGGQAHSCLVMKKPDFVILEADLPGESGYEICERFKQVEKGLPVLFLTEIELEESRDLAQRVGCDGYLTKPVDPELLVKSIKMIAEHLWQRTHGHDTAAKETSIRFFCRCGKKLKVSEAHRGRSLTCPECGEIITVPRHD